MINTNLIKLLPLSQRVNDLTLSSDLLELSEQENIDKNLISVADRIIKAKDRNASVILMMGAHVIRSGVQKYLIDLINEGFISCIATNGAGMIHDYEFALIGETTESVAKYIKDGKFGFWKETGEINNIINKSYYEKSDSGMGRVVGEAILNGDYPYKDISILAQAVKNQIPVTIHISIGQDIIHQFPNFDAAASGYKSYKDFLTLAGVIENLENGVVMNFGSAVMAPEVYLKALSMARNIARQSNKKINKFTTLVCDLHDLPDNFKEEAPKNSPAYYFRPWKTMLVRTVADGGASFYVKGLHKKSIPSLWTAIKNRKYFHK